MLLPAKTPPALIDRLVLNTDKPEEQAAPVRVSGLADAAQWILLGEPGSGKSTTFAQAAVAEGTCAVTARDFVEGERPRGKVLFIDAVEEYRIGELAHDRLDQLGKAIARAGYKRWRLTCRTLTPADFGLLRRTLGDHQTWRLDALDAEQQRAILASLGATDPEAVMQRVDDLAAAPLMGNPATLKLLYQTLETATQPIHSRGELFDHATRAMAAELDPDRPDRADRSTPGAIVAAAEKASIVLMLSAREDLWMLGSSLPPTDGMVTRDDLLPAEIDIKALQDAVDTPMFRGEAGRYAPSHRMVAEYLAGRALATSASLLDGSPAALPFRRAYALLCGADDSPAPAMLGTFAWFVTALAHGPHADRAMDLLKHYPEAILFQGDAAMLPPDHRRALLESTGSEDPWFLGGAQGTTAIGGLAGTDLEEAFRAILKSQTETWHRRAMVLEALRSGRRVPGLAADIEALIADPRYPESLRRKAIETVVARFPDAKAALRRIVNAMATEPARTAMTVKVQALAHLVGYDVTTAEAHAALKDYAGTGDGVMGYAWSFGDALDQNPPSDFFETSIAVDKLVGQSRSYEVRNLIERLLAATIRGRPKAKASDILRWLENAGFEPDEDPHEAIRYAIRDWVERRPKAAGKLFWALFKQVPDRAWHAPLAYSRLAGGEPPPAVVADVLARLKVERRPAKALQLAWLALQIFGRFDPANKVYWKLWRILHGRPELDPVFEQLTYVPLTHWQATQARQKRLREEKRAETTDKDRDWLANNLALVRSGAARHALEVAALHYCGHADQGHGHGRDRLVRWVGEEITEAILEGWSAFMLAFPLTWREQARDEAANTTAYANFLAASWADERISRKAALGPLSVDALFGIMRGLYALNGDDRETVETTIAAQIGSDPAARKALVSYWRSLVKSKPHDLQHSHIAGGLQDDGQTIAAFLSACPDPGDAILRSALGIAARSLPAEDLSALVEKTLRKTSLSAEARVLWRFAAFLLDPERHEAAFATDLKTTGIKALLDRVHHGHLIYGFDRLTRSPVARDRAIVAHIGPHYRPPKSNFGSRDDMSEVVAGALKTIAEAPTAEASAALAALASQASLKAWDELIRHHVARQTQARREAEFQPPPPKVVARALLAGPPAGPADLRAVVCEILDDLARDIQNGDTSGWRGFWHHPGDAATRRPKEENDCRDLLLDRVRDRLIRFGVGANRAFPEAQRRNNRRADILLIGEGAAALPIEAKRHLHTAIWTAGATQLPDYGRSPGSEGHGVYLIFWFGTEAGSVPKIPSGTGPVTTAQELQAALRGRQPKGLKPLIDIVVIDVSPPPDKPKKAKTKDAAAKRSPKAAAGSKAPKKTHQPAAKPKGAP